MLTINVNCWDYFSFYPFQTGLIANVADIAYEMFIWILFWMSFLLKYWIKIYVYGVNIQFSFSFFFFFTFFILFLRFAFDLYRPKCVSVESWHYFIFSSLKCFICYFITSRNIFHYLIVYRIILFYFAIIFIFFCYISS